MNQLVSLLGNGAGALGILCCVVAGGWRLGGNYWLGSMDAMTVFVVGTGLMVFACLSKLHLLLAAGPRP